MRKNILIILVVLMLIILSNIVYTIVKKEVYASEYKKMMSREIKDVTDVNNKEKYAYTTYDEKAIAEYCINNYISKISFGDYNDSYDMLYSKYIECYKVEKEKYISIQKKILESNLIYNITDIKLRDKNTYIITMDISDIGVSKIEYNYMIHVDETSKKFCIMYDGFFESNRGK